MHRLQVIVVTIVFLFCANTVLSSATTYYAVQPFQRDQSPLYGSIFSYNPISSQLLFFANFSFHIDDNTTDMAYFVPGPVAIVNSSSSLMYMCIESITSFQRLFLLVFDMKKKIYKQSRWILDDGTFSYLFYDPHRQRLIGLRDVDTFTLIMEEYNITTLDVVRKYTQQDGEDYAFPFDRCSIFDYEENWILEVRTRAEDLSISAYFIKMDLNLVGKKEDIVVDFHIMPDVHNLCTMTYDIKTKVVFATWQHGSIDRDLIMLYMNPSTNEFTNETLLLKTPRNWLLKDIQAIYNEQTREILFMIHHQHDPTFEDKYWIMLVEFDTMKVNEEKQITTIPDFEMWELFNL